MKQFQSRRLFCVATLPLVALAALAPRAALAQKAEPPKARLSGPSVVARNAQVEFTATGLQAGQPVSITIKTPDGAEAVYGAVAGPDGGLKVQVTPSLAGWHTVRLSGSDGRMLAEANMLAQA